MNTTTNNPILNLTQHMATVDQADGGVVEPSNKAAVQAALTFDVIPSSDDISIRAGLLARIAQEFWRGRAGTPFVLIGGAPWLMSRLEYELSLMGMTPVYAFSKRVSSETIDVNGNVIKTNIFCHAGFVTIG